MNVVKRACAYVTGAALALVSAVSMAVPIDISATAAAVETDLTHVVSTIGAVLLIAAGVAVAYKWGKAALFG